MGSSEILPIDKLIRENIPLKIIKIYSFSSIISKLWKNRQRESLKG
jgi:hypothetical protein